MKKSFSLILCGLTCAFVNVNALAQEPYIPPPMFGSEPSVTSSTTSNTSPASQKPRKHVIILEKQGSDITIKPPPRKPAPPQIPLKTATPSDYNALMPSAESAPAPTSGVVRGPKTMPALPAAKVTQEILYDGDSASQETIFERHQKTLKARSDTTTQNGIKSSSKILKPVPKPIKSNIKKAGFVPEPRPGVLKRTLPFTQGDILLPPASLAPLVQDVQSELSGKDAWRIMIRSFASPVGEGLSSDKRIALSRAVSVRKALLDSGIDPGRIDIRAEGAYQNPKDQPADRIDLYLFDPQSGP